MTEIRKEIDSQLFLPRMLYLRLNRRENLKVITIVCLSFNPLFLIIGYLFIDSTYSTRSYLGVNGDEFWYTFAYNNIQDGFLQLFSAFTGIFSILIGVYNIMNLAVIIYHAHKGGLRIRLKVAQRIYLVLNTIVFLYSIVPIALFSNMIILFPVFISLASINFFLTIILFLISAKVIRKELEIMLSVKLMKEHKEQYYQEYLTKNKALINLNPVEGAADNKSENEKIFIKN